MRARYLSTTKDPHNAESLLVSGEETFVSLNMNIRAGDEPAISEFPSSQV